MASGYIDFVLQWFINFQIRPYLLIPFYWIVGIFTGAIGGILDSIFLQNTIGVIRFSAIIFAIGIAPHIIFRIVVLPLQLPCRWLGVGAYAILLIVFAIYPLGGSSIYAIAVNTLIKPMTEGSISSGITRIIGYNYSRSFIFAIMASQAFGFYIARKVRFLENVKIGGDEAADVYMEMTTLAGRKMGYVKVPESAPIMHWAIQKGERISYPFFYGLGGGSAADRDVDIDVDL
jgi:hypothetical protein